MSVYYVNNYVECSVAALLSRSYLNEDVTATKGLVESKTRNYFIMYKNI